jgi:toxin CcdB
MAQFDVYRFAPRGAGFTYVVDLQNDLLEAFATRIVAPLYLVKGKQQPILRLNPVFQIDGKPHYLAVQEVTALRGKGLGVKVLSLSEHRPSIIAALDFLITGV